MNISYKDLAKKYNNPNDIPYHLLLSTEDWLIKRSEVLKRDGYFCQICGLTSSIKKHLGNGDFKFFTQKLICKDDFWDIEYVQRLKETILHVHHMFYLEGRLPWDYDNENLITFCCECHRKWHLENPVKYFSFDSEGRLIEKHYNICKRCSGAGWFPEYKNVDNGICFRCNGRRYEELIIRV